MAGIPHRVPVPGMDRPELRDQADFSVLQGFLGNVGILHIHEVALVEAPHLPVNLGADAEKAAGTELYLLRLGQVPVLHGVPPVKPGQRPRMGELTGQQTHEIGFSPGQVLNPAIEASWDSTGLSTRISGLRTK